MPILIDRETQTVKPGKCPDIFCDIPSKQYNKLRPLAVRQFFINNKKAHCFSDPDWNAYTAKDWFDHYSGRLGKGNVIRAMFRDIDARCYLMADGDDTYPAEHARDMVKLGWLYANGGKYEERQVISERWIAEEEKGNLAFTSCGKGDARGKGGMCGQMLMFSKEKRFAAAWHSFTTDGRLKGLNEFIEEIL